MSFRSAAFLLSLPLICSVFASVPNEGYYMQPSIRGDSIAFVSQGDIWKVGIHGGEAHALTSHVAPAGFPHLSPDGKRIAFTGSYDGPTDAYVMALDGELPKRITFHGNSRVQGWTQDGKVLVATYNYSTLPSAQLEIVEPSSRDRKLVPLAQASEGSYDPETNTLFFTRFAFQGSSTKRYRGGTAQNIWKFADGGEEATPLTASYKGTSSNPMVWNHRVYFLSDRDGVINIWSMNESGGDLKQHTFSTDWDVQSASIDSGRIAYQLGADLHVLDLVSKQDEKLVITLSSDFDQTRERLVRNPMAYVTAVNPSDDGSKVVFTARGQVFVAPAETGRFVEVSRKAGVRYRDATFTPDGKSVLVLSDQTGETEWWKLPANGVGSGEQITHGAKVINRYGTVSPDGKMLAYGNHDQELWVYDFTAKKQAKVVSCPDGSLEDLTWSPDSQWLAFTMPTISFNRIMLYSVKTGQITPLTTARADSGNPAWSPDGKWLYFLSDRTFQSAVHSPWGSRQPEPFFDKQAKIYMLALTPGLRSPFQGTDELYEESHVKPTPPVSISIDLNGIQDRLWEVPVAAGNYRQLNVTRDKLFFLSAPTGGGNPDLQSVDVKNKDIAVKTLVPAVQGFTVTRDQKKVLIQKDGRLYFTSVAGPTLEKPVDISAWTFFLKPQEEWKQMFVEAWRLERDYFYDPKLHSVDWNGILVKYQPLVDRVRDRSELSNLLEQMVGELTALHTFVYGGDERTPLDSIPEASLGAELVKDTAMGGFRVTKIYRGDPDYPNEVAPLAHPGADVRVGDCVLAVNGVDALSAPDISMLLRNQAGRQVLLHVKTSTGLARDCIVEPITVAALRNLRYSDWEISRRNKVDQASSNQIGYVHLRAMGAGDMAQWERDFYPAYDRAGLIIDVRHNNGGNIDSWIIEKLLRKAWFYWQPRVGNPSWNMQWAFRGHIVVLCDEGTASDGEAFTEGIKRLNLGKVIGTRTWGGEIWLSSDNVLVDGGIATAAETGVYGPEGRWLIENHGVDPDIAVDNAPHATFLGKDAQLEAAIAYLQKEIKAHPVTVPPHPNYPNKSFKPRSVVH